METKQWDAELKVTDTSHLEEMHKAIQALRGWPVFKREFNGVGLFTLGISIAYELERRRNHGKHDPSRYFSSITGQFEDSPKPVYEVAVGNIGTVYSGAWYTYGLFLSPVFLNINDRESTISKRMLFGN